jgi:hypothetical protein
VSSTPTPIDDPDPDDEPLGLDQLITEGMDPDDARAVLGPHTALPRGEICERYELLQRDGRDLP